MFRRFFLLPVLAAALLSSCTDTASDKPARLPILGEPDVRANPNGGPADTIHATAPTFRLTNQAGQRITNQTFAGQAYITDFFFATCPGICPKMQGELLKVFKKYQDDQRVAFLSLTIDPAHDSLPVLRDYAERLLNPYVAAERGFVDAVIEPAETRRVIGEALMTLVDKRERIQPRSHDNTPL